MHLAQIAHLLTSRHAEFGTAIVLVGDVLISIIAFNLTKDEEQAIAWANEQDETELLAIFPLEDGRDFMLLKRMHVKQNITDAAEELLKAIESNF